MSELDVMKLRGLVLASAEGRSTGDAIRFVREKHSRELAKVADYLLDKALGAMLQSGARRKATAILNDGHNLFGEFPVRGTRQVEVKTESGKSVKQYRKLYDVRIGQLRDEIQRLERRRLPEHKEVAILKAMVAKAEKFGTDETPVGEALLRAHQNE